MAYFYFSYVFFFRYFGGEKFSNSAKKKQSHYSV